MTRFLRLFPQFRNLEESLYGEVSSRVQIEQELESASTALQIEQAKRISAEAIAAERQAEIERLLVANSDLRSDLRSVTAERIKSVDAINLKLMEAKIPEPPVDFTQHKMPAALNMKRNLVNDIRAQHRAVGNFILAEQLKGFPKRHHMNQPTTEKIPSMEQIENTEI